MTTTSKADDEDEWTRQRTGLYTPTNSMPSPHYVRVQPTNNDLGKEICRQCSRPKKAKLKGHVDVPNIGPMDVVGIKYCKCDVSCMKVSKLQG